MVMILMQAIQNIEQALFMAFSMLWTILWPLILGFALSGIVQAWSHSVRWRRLQVVTRQRI